MLTATEVSQALPPQLRMTVNDEFVSKLNSISSDPEAARNIRENFISYTAVLREGRFKTDDYLNAVAYVSYKLMGYSNRESYARTFPQRYQGLVAKGTTDKDISAYVAAYNKNKLVNLVLEQTLVPIWVLNQDAVQRAINTQLDLMQNSTSDKVRCDAANSVLTHLKKPDKKEIELNLGVKDNSGMEEMKNALEQLAEQQRALIQGGYTTEQVAHQRLIPRENHEESAGDIIDAEVTELTSKG